MNVFLYVSYIQFFSPGLMFFRILALIFDSKKYRSRHDSNEECILLADIQHSQPHMTLYRADFFLFGVAIVNLM